MRDFTKKIGLALTLGAFMFFAACSSDDGGSVIGPIQEGKYKVSDGTYLAKIDADTTVSLSTEVIAFKVEDDGFATKSRSGHMANFMYLEPGNYLFIEVKGQSTADVMGGTAAEYNDDGDGNADGYTGGYTVVSGLSSSTAAFAVSTAGYYSVFVDKQQDEALMVKIDSWGVIGGAVFVDACTSNGFNADVNLDAEVTESASGATYKGEGVILKNAEFKFRYNDNWKIDRRVDPSAGYDDANGYVAITNFGGTVSALDEGGSNIGMADNSVANGTYDVLLSFDENGFPSLSLTRTDDAPDCAFEPSNYTWGIIGAATQPDGWSSDKKLTYINGDNGVHKWRGVFPMAAASSEFKFRTDDTWATKLTSGSQGEKVGTITMNTDMGDISNNGDVNDDGSWFVENLSEGFLYVEISTADQGGTWDIIMDEAVFEIIGAAQGSWDVGTPMNYNGDLASATASNVSLVDGIWKFRVNGSWDYNLGGSLTELVQGGGDLNATAGTASITITTADGGVTYTAIVQ